MLVKFRSICQKQDSNLSKLCDLYDLCDCFVLDVWIVWIPNPPSLKTVCSHKTSVLPVVDYQGDLSINSFSLDGNFRTPLWYRGPVNSTFFERREVQLTMVINFSSLWLLYLLVVAPCLATALTIRPTPVHCQGDFSIDSYSMCVVQQALNVVHIVFCTVPVICPCQFVHDDDVNDGI
jgi:hypothetical protein